MGGGVLFLTGIAKAFEHFAQVAHSADGHDYRDDEEGGSGHNKIKDPEIIPSFHNSICLTYNLRRSGTRAS